jgi:hypothetical protein
MVDKLTTFETFQRRKCEQESVQRERDDAERDGETRTCFEDIVVLVDNTEALAGRLENGLKRDLGQSAAAGELVEIEALRHMLRRYERYSWQLHDQLRGILDRARRGR